MPPACFMASAASFAVGDQPPRLLPDFSHAASTPLFLRCLQPALSSGGASPGGAPPSSAGAATCAEAALGGGGAEAGAGDCAVGFGGSFRHAGAAARSASMDKARRRRTRGVYRDGSRGIYAIRATRVNMATLR